MVATVLQVLLVLLELAVMAGVSLVILFEFLSQGMVLLCSFLPLLILLHLKQLLSFCLLHFIEAICNLIVFLFLLESLLLLMMLNNDLIHDIEFVLHQLLRVPLLCLRHLQVKFLA